MVILNEKTGGKFRSPDKDTVRLILNAILAVAASAASLLFCAQISQPSVKSKS